MFWMGEDSDQGASKVVTSSWSDGPTIPDSVGHSIGESGSHSVGESGSRSIGESGRLDCRSCPNFRRRAVFWTGTRPRTGFVTH